MPSAHEEWLRQLQIAEDDKHDLQEALDALAAANLRLQQVLARIMERRRHP